MNNDFGNANTAIGFFALTSNTDGVRNTAIGHEALYANTIGAQNTATGSFALQSNTTGMANTATGDLALELNTTGSFNTAIGLNALGSNTTGNRNTAINTNALASNTTGSDNTAIGVQAGSNLTIGNNNIDIGNGGVAGESATIRIGTAGTQTATFIAGINTSPLAVAVGVGITADGQLGVRASSARFKEAIKPMDTASEAILSLRPVSFRYRKAFDPKSEPQFGLIAEEVAKVDPGLVVKDEKGQPFTVRYEEVNAMLLNEFLKEHRKVESLETTVAQQRDDFRSAFAQQKDLRSTVAQQQRQIDALRSQMQTVSDQRAASQTAPPLLVKSR